MKAVVIGAGIVGASIGYHLAARGADVTLIDKNKPGSGASSHSFAWINAGPKSPFEYHDLNRRSLVYDGVERLVGNPKLTELRSYAREPSFYRIGDILSEKFLQIAYVQWFRD